ncbi:MAG: hypothetical protein M1840_007500 [Geoglossum simile]|nr:MAG: hypothetical protein M1840_007500 [Geoglossum simile]
MLNSPCCWSSWTTKGNREPQPSFTVSGHCICENGHAKAVGNDICYSRLEPPQELPCSEPCLGDQCRICRNEGKDKGDNERDKEGDNEEEDEGDDEGQDEGEDDGEMREMRRDKEDERSEKDQPSSKDQKTTYQNRINSTRSTNRLRV